MFNSFFALFCFFYAFSFTQEICDELPWNNEKKITWQNFKDKPDLNSAHSAITDCRIKMNYYSKKDTLFVNVGAILVQSGSWVKVKSKTVALLRHEQVHFDIAEIYARKLRQSISVLKTTKIKVSEQITLLDKWNDENLKDYQSRYDNETANSVNKKKQVEWDEKVAKELKQLDRFKDTLVKILLVK